jgi:recombination protein RecT
MRNLLKHQLIEDFQLKKIGGVNMANVNEVKNKLAKKEGAKTPNPKSNTIRTLLERMKPELAKVLPKHLEPDRILRIALTEIRRNPKLLDASRESLLGAVMLSAQLGLEPGPLGHCYLIPYYNSKTKSYEVQFQLGYKGMLDLVRRSGQIEMIDAHVVYENDEFDYQYGLEPKLYHKPSLKTRGKPIAVYAIAKFKDGGFSYLVMSIEDIEKIRKRSKTPDNGPWVTDWEAMAKKTVIKQLCKYLPLSIEVQRNIAVDETTKKVNEDLESPDEILDQPDETDWNIIDVEPEQQDSSEPEAENKEQQPEEENPQEQKEIPNPFVKE